MSVRLLSPVSYLMYPYGFFRFSMLWFVPLGIIGLWVGLRRMPMARVTAALYAALFSGYLVAFGAPSQYWGQALMPLLVIGTAMLLASLDALGQPASWVVRLAQPDSASTIAPDGKWPKGRAWSDSKQNEFGHAMSRRTVRSGIAMWRGR